MFFYVLQFFYVLLTGLELLEKTSSRYHMSYIYITPTK